MRPNDSQSPSIPSADVVAFAEVRRINQKPVREICGGISYMTLWRWMNDPAMNFPRPIIIGRLRYWREAEVIAWLQSREVAQ